MTRAELCALAESYLDALESRDFARLPWADDAIFTENNVRLEPGDAKQVARSERKCCRRCRSAGRHGSPSITTSSAPSIS